MATTTAFDLSLAIQRWRENLGQSPAFRNENLNELEAHLRDSVDAMQTLGLSSVEAFLVASKRIGRSDALGMEFSKVNRPGVWLDRMLWVLIGFQLSLVVFDACRIVSVFSALPMLDNSSVLGLYIHFTGGTLERSLMANSVLAMPLVTALLALCVWKLSYRPENRARTFFSKLLKQPLVLAFSFLLLGMAMRLLSTSFYVFMVSESSPRIEFPGFEATKAFPILTNVLVQLPQYALCAMLTVYVARKRFSLTRA